MAFRKPFDDDECDPEGDGPSGFTLRERTIELGALALWAERKRHGGVTGITGWRDWADEDPRCRDNVRREVEAALVAVGAITGGT